MDFTDSHRLFFSSAMVQLCPVCCFQDSTAVAQALVCPEQRRVLGYPRVRAEPADRAPAGVVGWDCTPDPNSLVCGHGLGKAVQEQQISFTCLPDVG